MVFLPKMQLFELIHKPGCVKFYSCVILLFPELILVLCHK